MIMGLTDEQQAIGEAVRRICADFGDAYWTEHDQQHRFPHDFHRAMAEAGFLGITMPEAVGGSGLGVLEAAVMMEAVSSSGGAFSAASAIHINMFGPHAIVEHGTDEQRARMLAPLVKGEQKACFGVTEPDAGLDTTSIKTFAQRRNDGYIVNGRKMWTTTAQEADKILILARTTPKAECARPTDGMTLFFTDLDREKIEVRRIAKMGRNAVDSNAVFIDDLFVPEADRIGEEGKGFRYLLDSLNPERILIAAEAIGLGRDALARAAKYARERVVFGRPIGQNQSIQHPLAECWANLEAAWWMTVRAGALYDSGHRSGAEANAAKLLGARAGHAAAFQAVKTMGGMGYSTEFQVERLMRESIVPVLAPVSEQMILNFLSERVLDLPKSY
ncbi:MAG: acyl-CoA dehydrogenase family protein [Pseudomonadota bacterium]